MSVHIYTKDTYKVIHKRLAAVLITAIFLTVLLLNSSGCTSTADTQIDQTPPSNIENTSDNKTQNITPVPPTKAPDPSPTPEPTPTPVPDYDPPVLIGVVNRQFYVGEGISYLSGVTAYDEIDGEVEITVDRSNVNTRKPGQYEVTYTATDKAGNSVSQTAIITLSEVKVTEEMLDKAADEVLTEITTDDMTMEEKAWAIYKYVNVHVRYWDDSDKNDWRAEAYRGITEGWGDCFTYFAVSQILLMKIGADILPVERQGGVSRHYWHIINIGSGWYHFDACIHIPKYVSFMRTDAEFEEFAALQRPGYNYYTYDKEKYPEVSTTPFEWDRTPPESEK